MGEIISVCSATGGTGRTMITVNLSVILAERNKKVIAMDGDLQFGDLSMAMDLVPPVTIADMQEDSNEKDALAYCQKHASGVSVLAAPPRPELADLITESKIKNVLDSLKGNCDYLIVDTAPGFNDRSLPVLEKADRILVVTSNGMAALKNTKLMLETLDKLELISKVSVLVNRSTSVGSIQAGELTNLLGTNRLFYLSNDYKHVSYSLETGQPLVLQRPNLEISKAIRNIADELFPEEARLRTERKQGLLQNILRRSRK